MNDSPPETPEMARQRIMALSGVERMRIGCRMFDEERARIIASLPKFLSKIEFKRQLFQRIYGYPLPADFQAPSGAK